MIKQSYTYVQYVVFLTFLLLGLMNLQLWEKENKYQLTGDEPHYLVLTESILRYGSIGPVLAYVQEFKNRRIFKPGLAPPDAIPDATNAHIYAGPNGGYSFHLPGLPLLIMPSYAIGGIYGVKCFLVMFSAFGAILLYRLACQWHTKGSAFFWTSVFTLSYPYFYSASQIYPESPAAVLIILIFYSGRQTFLCDRSDPRWFRHLTVVALAIAFLPWLHSKFAVVALPLGLIIFGCNVKRGWDGRVLPIFAIPAVSGLCLITYNSFAFGKIIGPFPYHDEVSGWVSGVSFHSGSLNTALGTFFDQSQGIFFVFPVTWVAIFFKSSNKFNIIGVLSAGMVVSLTVLIILNGLHENRYLGYSFVGRSSLPAVLMICCAAIFVLDHLKSDNRAVYFIVGVAAIFMMIYGFVISHHSSFDFYNATDTIQYKGDKVVAGYDLRHADGTPRIPYVWPWLESYSFFYFPIGAYLPAFMAPWFRQHFPNYAFTFLFVLLLTSSLTAGFRERLRSQQSSTTPVFLIICSATMSPRGLVATVLLLLVALLVVSPGQVQRLEQPYAYASASLYGQTGSVRREARVAIAGRDSPGLLTFGPAFRFRAGEYELAVDYAYAGGPASTGGALLVIDVLSGEKIAETPLLSTDGERRIAAMKFETQRLLTPVALWVNWSGEADLEVSWFTLRRDR